MKTIVEKINNCETAKSYKDYGYEMIATEADDKLTVTANMAENKSTNVWKRYS